jgi:hypothetical protein
MIRHIVLVRYRPEVTEAEIARIHADLEGIRSLLPGMGPFRAGRSESPEMLERGYMHGFTVDFEDWAALAAYQEHAEHRRVGDAIVAGAIGGVDGILVFDLPVDGPVETAS